MVLAEVSFWVPGIPRPGGSKRFVGFGKKTGKSIIIDDCKRNKDWKTSVATTAYEAMHDRPLLTGPLRLEVTFWLLRPKSHYTRSGCLRSSAPTFPEVKPDATKLLRAVEDALTGIVWQDDAQIVDQYVRKRYINDGHSAGAAVEIYRM